MRLDDTRKPPLWVEQGEEIYGDNVTPTEFATELDELPPRLRLLQGAGGSSSSRCHVNSPGVDPSPTVAPLHRRAPAADSPSCPGGGPDLDSAA